MWVVSFQKEVCGKHFFFIVLSGTSNFIVSHINLHCIKHRCVLFFSERIDFNLLMVIIFHPVNKQTTLLHGKSLS